MTSPRRAATEQVEVITNASDSPRRAAGVGALRPFVRKAIAPAAIVGVLVAATVLTFVPVDSGTSVADPLHQAQVDLGVSRSRERQPILDLPTGDPSPTMVSSIGAVPSAVVPSTTPTAAAASPTPSPDTVTPSHPTTEPAEAPVAASAVPAETESAAPASPAPVETPAPEPAPEVDWSVLGEESGTLWATASVNVRTGPGTDHDVITTLRSGDDVTITTSTADGWQQVVVSGDAGWIKGSFLSEEEPQDTGSSSGINTSACNSVSGSTSGMTANAIQVRNAVCNAFPNVSSIGGYRSGGGSYHSSGRAIDVMISGEAGWEVARWARANAGQLGVIEVIYSQQIWTTQRSGDGWRWMSDRGSSSANHYDHVHISVR
ncbi:hypothetical protein GCM10028820_12870 [Tessaracoccus terricola]